jgi:deazaflavin-dependent oxidoreductase (nitroreductase family)
VAYYEIIIDREKCSGAGVCVVLASGTFDVGDDAKAYVLDPEGDELDVIRQAAEACPNRAIEVKGKSVSDDANYTPPDLSLIGDSHIAAYEATDGEQGYLWNGATCLVLRTTGAKTGQPRKSALIYAAAQTARGDAYVLIASQGGAPTHPNWYHNLVAHPDCEVQVKGDIIPVRARTAEGAEREELWNVAATQWPNYNEYTKRTDRVIPVVVLEKG